MAEGTVKAHNDRTGALPPKVVAALRAHQRRQRRERVAAEVWAAPGDYVVCNEIGEPLTGQQLYRAFLELSASAGIAPASPYALRHSAISFLVDQGVPLQVVADLAGNTLTVMAKHYRYRVGGAIDATAAKRGCSVRSEVRQFLYVETLPPDCQSKRPASSIAGNPGAGVVISAMNRSQASAESGGARLVQRHKGAQVRPGHLRHRVLFAGFVRKHAIQRRRRGECELGQTSMFGDHTLLTAKTPDGGPGRVDVGSRTHRFNLDAFGAFRGELP